MISPQDAAKLILAAQQMTSAERKELQHTRLVKLVNFARKNSPFFQKHYADLPENFSLTDIPYTTKAMLSADYENWLTERGITKQDVFDYINADPKTRGLFKGKFTALATSGTTGEPMPMIRDMHRNIIHGVLMQMRLIPPEFMKYADVKQYKTAALITKDPRASAYNAYLRMLAANPDSAQNLLLVPITINNDEKIRLLNEFQPDIISCYPSEMALMAVYQKKGLLNISPKGIACSAEKLSLEMYNTIKETFNCPIVNNYCMTEGGEVAFGAKCPHLHINEDWVIVEPVDENKQVITDENVWSHGIFVTDLSNFIQPIIRYYVEDSVRIHESCECGNTLPWMEIHGRNSGVYEICGGTLTTMQIHEMEDIFSEALVIQLVQVDDKTLQVRAILAETVEADKLSAQIFAEMDKILRRAGCKDYSLTWSDEPPIKNVRGGKLRPFVRVD